MPMKRSRSPSLSMSANSGDAYWLLPIEPMPKGELDGAAKAAGLPPGNARVPLGLIVSIMIWALLASDPVLPGSANSRRALLPAASLIVPLFSVNALLES